MAREGGCFCGALRYVVTGEPTMVSHCHCLHCRRLSGAAFVTWSTFAARDFRFTQGKPATVTSRPGVTREFCSACGSPISYRSVDFPEDVDLTTCTFDEPASMKPVDHVWADREIPWAHLDDGLRRFGRRRQDG